LLGKHCIVGSNSVVLPNVKFNEGSSVGALSLVNRDLEAWKLYAGIPAKFIGERDRNNITILENEFKKRLRNEP